MGNKNDLDAEDRVISYAEGANLAKSWGCPFIEASALSKSSVSKVFEKLLEEIELQSVPGGFGSTQRSRGGGDAPGKDKCILL